MLEPLEEEDYGSLHLFQNTPGYMFHEPLPGSSSQDSCKTRRSMSEPILVMQYDHTEEVEEEVEVVIYVGIPEEGKLYDMVQWKLHTGSQDGACGRDSRNGRASESLS